MHQLTDLAANRRDHARVAVAEARHANTAQKVEVLVALDVPQVRALAAHELDREARVGAHHARALELLELGQGHGAASILVPIPASVKSSRSSECAIRPSRIWAALTPAWMASTQASSLGRMPP